MINFKQLINEELDTDILKGVITGTYIIDDDGRLSSSDNILILQSINGLLPVKFNKVDGVFSCANLKLTSLEGCPNKVGQRFSCSYNNLKSLEGGPIIVGNDFFCSFNQLKSLKGCPDITDGSLVCPRNQLRSIQGIPRIINWDVNCSRNKLTSLNGCPILIKHDFNCNYNKLTTLDYFPDNVGGDFSCYSNTNLPYSELFKIVDKVKGKIYYASPIDPENKDKIRRDRDRYYALRHDELGNLDI